MTIFSLLFSSLIEDLAPYRSAVHHETPFTAASLLNQANPCKLQTVGAHNLTREECNWDPCLPGIYSTLKHSYFDSVMIPYLQNNLAFFLCTLASYHADIMVFKMPL